MAKKVSKKVVKKNIKIERKPEPRSSQTLASIRVIGIGGSGGNAVNHMIKLGLKGVEFIAANTDLQDLHKSKAAKKIHLGIKSSHGLGAGMNPAIGEKAAIESLEDIREAFIGSDILFIACGMGGGTGTGASPIIAKAAQDLGILTVSVVTRPFSFEGIKRQQIADSGLIKLSENSDAVVIIPNDTILAISTESTSLSEAFSQSDEVLFNAVAGITQLIVKPGDINIDFADVAAIMKQSGRALIGIGYAKGVNKAEIAITRAIASPLLENSLKGTRRVLYSVSSRTRNEISMKEIQIIAERIQEQVHPEAKIIFGTTTDRNLKKGEICVTVIATDHEDNEEQISSFIGIPLPEKKIEYIPHKKSQNLENIPPLSDFIEEDDDYIVEEDEKPNKKENLLEPLKKLWKKK